MKPGNKKLTKKEKFSIKAYAEPLKETIQRLSNQSSVKCSFHDRLVILYKENQQPDKYNQVLRGRIRDISSGDNTFANTAS